MVGVKSRFHLNPPGPGAWRNLISAVTANSANLDWKTVQLLERIYPGPVMLDFPIVRLAASAISLVGVPMLLVLACRAWATRHRVALPAWRNGIGLTAVSLLALAWTWFAVGLADTSLTARLSSTFLDLTVLAVICTWLSVAFASAWKGHSRLQVLAACALMLVGWHFFGYGYT